MIASRRFLTSGLAAIAAAFALVLAVGGSPALAVAPALTSVAQQDRHPTVKFTAPRADVVVSIASKPTQATDGSFLQENVTFGDALTGAEENTGAWTGERKLDPGLYYVAIKATPRFPECLQPRAPNSYNPACAFGYSNVIALRIPAPKTVYRATVSVRRKTMIGELALKADPLGITQPYNVCYRTKIRRKKCVKRTLPGYSWDSSARDVLRISLRDLAERTKFTWYKRGTTTVLAQRTVTTS